ncbi:murein L,D-transpeptidase catalytic domain family protein [Novosphingobium profundi]|uniref:murein L,D-transpeptidase catalytic domain family protein n=1 Tax=Novosphingobium profundi TaxID=1774954 RepID=UPI001BD9D23C|nr:murein L,D-transpeptidase catalytic domain family protein [Novosphingobium profundi]MBT0670517.1 murein L,D-transpeptidase catalytic domain family protein [Novosphingobium profundi]
MLITGAVGALGVLTRRSSLLDPVGPQAPPASRAPTPRPAAKAVPATPKPEFPQFAVNPHLLDKARSALDRHGRKIAHRDRIALIDFTVSSSKQRLHLLDLEAGTAKQMLVAHGSGSDPAHTGFLERFSNVSGSNASSRGAYVTADYYVGKHGRSQRLLGLDPTNDNALERAIVLHSAWYANEDMLRSHGMLGRSQGCFAVGENCLSEAFAFLGEGRMIYADRA